MLSPSTIQENSTGAFRQSWLGDSPRERLERLISRGAGKLKIKTELWKSVRNDEAILKVMFEYWFANNYLSATRTRQKRFSSKQEIEMVKEQLKDRVKSHIAHEVKIRLLDMKMPSGKKLSNSTREELLAVGGWAVQIADLIASGQTVAEAGLTEEDLRELYTA